MNFNITCILISIFALTFTGMRHSGEIAELKEQVQALQIESCDCED